MSTWFDWSFPSVDDILTTARSYIYSAPVEGSSEPRNRITSGLGWLADLLLGAIQTTLTALIDQIYSSLDSRLFFWSTMTIRVLVLLVLANIIRKVGGWCWATFRPLWVLVREAGECVASVFNYVCARPRMITVDGVSGTIPPLRGALGARPFDNEAV